MNNVPHILSVKVIHLATTLKILHILRDILDLETLVELFSGILQGMSLLPPYSPIGSNTVEIFLVVGSNTATEFDKLFQRFAFCKSNVVFFCQ